MRISLATAFFLLTVITAGYCAIGQDSFQAKLELEDQQTLPNLYRVHLPSLTLHDDSKAKVNGKLIYPENFSVPYLDWELSEPETISFHIAQSELTILRTETRHGISGRFFGVDRHPSDVKTLSFSASDLILTIPSMVNLPDSFLTLLKPDVAILEYQRQEEHPKFFNTDKLTTAGSDAIPPEIKARLVPYKSKPETKGKGSTYLFPPELNLERSFSKEKKVFPVFLTNIEVDEKDGRLFLSASKHVQTNQLVPGVCLVPSGESGHLLTKDQSLISVTQGMHAEMKFVRRFKTATSELNSVEVEALLPSGKQFPIADLKAQLKNSRSGFLLNSLQDMHSDFAELIRSDVPVFKLTKMGNYQRIFRRSNYSVSKPVAQE